MKWLAALMGLLVVIVGCDSESGDPVTGMGSNGQMSGGGPSVVGGDSSGWATQCQELDGSFGWGVPVPPGAPPRSGSASRSCPSSRR